MAHTNTLTKAAAAAALSIGSLATAQEAVQWRAEDGGNGHWYQLVISGQPMSHATAQELSVSRGAQLASLCGSEFDFAVSSTGALRPEAWQQSDSSQWIGPWIGLELTEGGWAWTDGSACQFDRWDTGLGQPDTLTAPGEPFAFLYAVGESPAPFVHDVPMTVTTRSAIIEWSADCNNDGIVDYGQIRSGQLPDVNGNGIPDGCDSNSGQYSPIQWPVNDGGNGHWYQPLLTAQGIGWTAARSEAVARGGDLACAETAAERIYFFQTFSTAAYPSAWTPQAQWTEANFGPWLGGTQLVGSPEPLGGWTWVTGSSFDPTELGCCDNVGCAGPEDRLHLLLAEGTVTWNDLPDTWTCGAMPRSLLIEWSADCNNDGIVDFGQIRAGELEDANGNNIPDCCEGGASCNCPGDVIPDGVVDGVDLAAVLGQWGSAGDKSFSADANGDGTVDAGDLSIVLNGWGACP
jgi:hypothetical protein